MLILKSYKTGLLVDVTLNALVLPADKIGSDRGNRGVPLMTAIDFPLQEIPVRVRGLDLISREEGNPWHQHPVKPTPMSIGVKQPI
jgi:hypothetical protein